MGACEVGLEDQVVTGKPKQLGPKRKGLIPVIDRRLADWGCWRLANEGKGTPGGTGGSMLSQLIDCQGELIRSTGLGAGSMPDDIFDTDRAVLKLELKLRMVVETQYLDGISTREEKASKCGCSRDTFYRRLHSAHEKVLFLLKSPSQAV